MITAKGYVRYSSTNQRQESLESQKEIITRYAEKNNIKLIGFYEEYAQSGATDRRTEFQRMISDSTTGEFNAVIVIQLDRFSRSVTDTLKYMEILQRNNVALLSVNESNEDTPESRLLRLMQMGIAQFANEKLGRETMRGLLLNASHAKSTGGCAPLGYITNSDMMLEIHPEESKIVKLIFRLYANGKSYQEILRELDLNQYRTRKNNMFSKNSIYEILRNEKYNGVYVFNKRSSKGIDGRRNNNRFKSEEEIVKVENGCPKLVEDQTWKIVTERLKNNKKRSGAFRAKHDYILSGKVWCKCGFGMSGNCHSKGRQVYLSYVCNQRSNKCSCDNRSIGANILHEFVISQLIRYIFRKKDVPKLTKGLNKYVAKNMPNNENIIKDKRMQIKSLKERISNLLVALEDGTANEEIKTRLKELENNKNELLAEIEALKKEEEVIEIAEDEVLQAIRNLKDYLMNNPSDARALIDTYVKKVTVSKEKIDVIFRSPVNLSDKYDPNLSESKESVA